jgi:hypothetical protein
LSIFHSLLENSVCGQAPRNLKVRPIQSACGISRYPPAFEKNQVLFSIPTLAETSVKTGEFFYKVVRRLQPVAKKEPPAFSVHVGIEILPSEALVQVIID